MIFLEQDNELAPWIYGILHDEPTRSGDFLLMLARAATSADPENYDILRPALIRIHAKYPKYRCTHDPRWPAHPETDGER